MPAWSGGGVCRIAQRDERQEVARRIHRRRTAKRADGFQLAQRVVGTVVAYMDEAVGSGNV